MARRYHMRRRGGAGRDHLSRQLEDVVRLLSGRGSIERILERQIKRVEQRLQAQLETHLKQSVEQLFSGFLGGNQGMAGSLLGLLQGGSLPGFADGGIVDGAQILALAGENGPEAILPLRRGADGQLGVASMPLDQPQTDMPPININLTTDRAETFDDADIDNMASVVSQALNEALDQAVASRVETYLRDGGLLNPLGRR